MSKSGYLLDMVRSSIRLEDFSELSEEYRDTHMYAMMKSIAVGLSSIIELMENEIIDRCKKENDEH